MATIKFLLKSKKNPATIYVRVREGRAIDVYSPTSKVINPNDWSKTKGLPKQKNEKLKKLNTQLTNLQSTIITRLNEREVNEVVNGQWVKDIISPPRSAEIEELPGNLIHYFDFYIKRLESKVKTGEIAESTITKYKGVKKLLVGMQVEHESPILIKNINLNFKSEFDQYCLKNNYAPNTIGRGIRFIKTVCRDARTNGLETHAQLDLLKGKTHKVDHIHLTFDELELLNKERLSEHLENAKDWLIISCYTGQRVSDFLRFTKDMIRTEKDKKLIEFTQKKTGKIMTIPLHNKILEILSKRKGEFPNKISSQHYNEHIKEVCRQVGLTKQVKGSKQNATTQRKETGIYPKWELVTSHIGRRSFATNYYGIIPTPLLIHATGHSSEQQFLIYIGKTDTQKAMQLADYL
jgi:integrase